jgi:hypothetical protein
MSKMILKQLFDGRSISSRNKPEMIFKILQKIQFNEKFEPPNSATFSMAIDCIESKGKLFVVNQNRRICDFRNIKQIRTR